MCSRLGERQQCAALFVPEMKSRVSKTFPKRKPLGLCQDIVVTDHLAQAVEGYAAGEVMHMVKTDVCGNPTQNTRQILV